MYFISNRMKAERKQHLKLENSGNSSKKATKGKNSGSISNQITIDLESISQIQLPGIADNLQEANEESVPMDVA